MLTCLWHNHSIITDKLANNAHIVLSWDKLCTCSLQTNSRILLTWFVLRYGARPRHIETKHLKVVFRISFNLQLIFHLLCLCGCVTKKIKRERIIFPRMIQFHSVNYVIPGIQSSDKTSQWVSNEGFMGFMLLTQNQRAQLTLIHVNGLLSCHS